MGERYAEQAFIHMQVRSSKKSSHIRSLCLAPCLIAATHLCIVNEIG